VSLETLINKLVDEHVIEWISFGIDKWKMIYNYIII